MNGTPEAGGIAGKPRFRGVSHGLATLPALIAALRLAQRPESDSLQIGVLIYGTTLVLLFAVSAFYHIPNWRPEHRLYLRRLDRSMVYLFVAGGFTPYFMVIQTDDSGWVLPVVWSGAALGSLKSILFPKAPRVITAGLYVVLGLTAAPFFPDMVRLLGSTVTSLIVVGGLAYIIGASCYALKRPNPIPGAFGYHECFHLLVIAGASLHYAGAWIIVG